MMENRKPISERSSTHVTRPVAAGMTSFILQANLQWDIDVDILCTYVANPRLQMVYEQSVRWIAF